MSNQMAVAAIIASGSFNFEFSLISIALVFISEFISIIKQSASRFLISVLSFSESIFLLCISISVIKDTDNTVSNKIS